MGLLAGVLAVALPAPAPIAPEYVALGHSCASGAGAGSGCRTMPAVKRAALNDAADQLSGEIAAEPWINALVNPAADSYHPNKAGQAAYFRALTS